MQSSKKNIYVLAQNVRRGTEERLADKFREGIGQYWHASLESGELQYGDPAQQDLFETQSHMQISYGAVATSALVNPPYCSKTQQVYLVGDEGYWGAETAVGELPTGTWNEWEALMGGVASLAGKQFVDHFFRIDTPFTQAERKKVGDVSGLGYVDIDFNYNYYNQRYEEGVRGIIEQALPNIYSFITDDPSRNMYYLRTLNGYISAKLADIKLEGSGFYWDYIAKAYQNLTPQRQQSQFKSRFRNFIVPFENLSLLSDLTLKEAFPMFVELEFSTDSVTEIAQILEESSLSTSLQRSVAAACGGTNSSLLAAMGGATPLYYYSRENMTYSAVSSEPMTVGMKNYKCMDLFQWWNKYMGGQLPSMFGDQSFVGPQTYSGYISSGVQENSLAQALSLLIFSGKLKTIIKNNNRSFKEIVEGKACHSETVIYRVAKYKGKASQGSQPIQNYWFPNSNNIDIINLVDSQVKYGSQYTYVVYAYQAVIGSKYSYGPLTLTPPQINTETFTTCPDLDFPKLKGLECISEGTIDMGDAGTQTVLLVDGDCAGIDAGLVHDTIVSMGTNLDDINDICSNVLLCFVFGGALPALGTEMYKIEFLTRLRDLLSRSYPVVYLVEALNLAMTNYSAGEIESVEYPPSTEVVTTTVDAEYIAGFQVTTTPHVKLVEVPYFSQSGWMVDSPPLAPDVNIIQYKGENDKVLIWLNSTIGEQELYPISIYPEDEEHIAELRLAKDLNPSDPITYRSDDKAAAFEILRLSEKPEKYSDFMDNQRAFLGTQIQGEKSSSAVSYLDSVVPNQKYYYTFRAIDEHGNTSNPTQVFEVELVDNDGAVFMVMGIIPLEETPDPYDVTKEAKRYVQIVPRITQGVFNPELSNLEGASTALAPPGSYTLGVEDESIWGKKYKVRFISKSTGRKIDLNITYDKGHITTSTEMDLRKTILPTGTTIDDWSGFGLASDAIDLLS
tara:strand:- start:3231 stop:6104 length:2874 start_codon:yes stop_codon:yes gene_type:complete